MNWKDSIMANLGIKRSTRSTNTDPRISIEVISGLQYLGLPSFRSMVVICQNSDGNLYFENLNGLFTVVEYSWDGPVYQNVTSMASNTKGSLNEKTRRKGGIGGAIAGTMLSPVPGAGAAIGYMATSKKHRTNTTNSDTRMRQVENQVEIPGVAKLVLKNIVTGAFITIGFKCTSQIDLELSNFIRPFFAGAEMQAQEQAALSNSVEQQKSNVELLKEYKELLDMGIITQDDFNAKKKQLLGL